MRERQLDPVEIPVIQFNLGLPDWQMTFIERMRLLMDRTGKTNKEIAADLNDLMYKKYGSDKSFSEASLSNYITIKKRPTVPSADALLAFSDYFGVTSDFLLGSSASAKVSHETITKAVGLGEGAISKLKALKALERALPSDVYKDYSLALYPDNFTIVKEPETGKKYAVTGKPEFFDLQEELKRAPDGYFRALDSIICCDDLIELIAQFLTPERPPKFEEKMLSDLKVVKPGGSYLKKVSHVRSVTPKQKEYEDVLLAGLITEKLRELKKVADSKEFKTKLDTMDFRHVPNYPTQVSQKETQRVKSLQLTYMKEGLPREEYKPIFDENTLSEDIVKEMQNLENEVNNSNDK